MESTNRGDPIQAATHVFHALVSSRLTDKYKAVEFLDEPDCPADLPTLRTLLVKAITKDYYVGKEDEQDDPDVARTRSWLLGALAHISAGDDETTELVKQHIDRKFEPNPWARYWALEGLITGNNPQTELVARSAIDDKEPLVSMLATAYLASLNDRQAAEKIRKSFEKPDLQWSVLRALRVVPLPMTVPVLCRIVEGSGFTDAFYDAIMALGKVPSTWTHSARAAQALCACIVKIRGTPWKDSLRANAITSLGNLRVESSAPLVLDELADDNPAVVREAARSIAKIIGLNLTVIRVVEAASRGGPAEIDLYARALRWMNREAVAEELETLMTSGSARQQDMARILLSELGGAVAFEKLRARTDAMKQYSEILEKTEEKIRDLFEASVHEAQNGFQYAVIMDVTVFAVGILLLLGSAGYALFRTGDLTSWAGIGVTGGLGVLGIIYGVLIANPRRQVRESVDHLMIVKIEFLAYLRRLHQADQAYTRRLLDDEPITVEQVGQYADIIRNIMDTTLQWLSKASSAEASKEMSNTSEG